MTAIKTIKRRRLSDEVVSGIKKMIIERGLKPGDRLPSEQELANQFGVSRLSLREATKTLAFFGILESCPGRGLSIGQVDMDRVTEYLGFHFALAGYPTRRLLQARSAIEIGALRQVSRMMAEDETVFPRLAEINSRLQEAGDFDRGLELDAEFHRALIESSGIEPLIAFADLLSIFFRRIKPDLQAHLGQWIEGCKNHGRILEALRDGDIATAESLLDEHLRYPGLQTDEPETAKD